MALLIILIGALLFPLAGKDKQGANLKGRTGVIVPEWLLCGPESLPFPVLAGEGAEFTIADLAGFDNLDPLQVWSKRWIVFHGARIKLSSGKFRR